jgi:hypothetical protein
LTAVVPASSVDALPTRGRSIAALTSPLTAVALVDQAVQRALLSTGLFEEFDVSRRALHVWPEDAMPPNRLGRGGPRT